MNKSKRRLVIGLICYGVLILIGLYGLLPVRTSHEAFILGALLLVFALLIIKTIVHSQEDGDE